MRVLFVCTGNINRSAAAEIIYSTDVGGDCKSCGTGKTAMKRGRMASKMRRVLQGMGYPTEDFRSTPINEDLLDWADKVVCMGKVHMRKIGEEYPRFSDKCVLWEVKDPHFSPGEEVHSEVASQIRELVHLHFSPQ